MKHLITGGAGFIGSHLIDKLLNKGETVYCLDNISTGSIENIKKHFDNPSFEFINHDVINPIELNIERIWHLACPASPKHYQSDPIKTTKTSFLGTLNMLELAKNTKSDILLASTSEVYGDPEIHPQPEKYRGSVNPIGIRSCYDEGKRIAESLSFDYHRQHNIKIHVARIFNTYGPRMHPDDGRVVSNFICQAIRNKPITVYGNGNQTRSFCYVDDLVKGLDKLMFSKSTGPINIGNPNEFTILELANYVKKKTNSSSEIIFEKLPNDDPKQRKPFIDLAKEEINWEPEINLNDGLAETIEYFKKVLKNN